MKNLKGIKVQFIAFERQTPSVTKRSKYICFFFFTPVKKGYIRKLVGLTKTINGTLMIFKLICQNQVLATCKNLPFPRLVSTWLMVQLNLGENWNCQKLVLHHHFLLKKSTIDKSYSENQIRYENSITQFLKTKVLQRGASKHFYQLFDEEFH